MATASRNFDFTDASLEGTTERGFSGTISTLLDSGSPSLEFTQSSGTNQVEGRFGGAADTWESLFGIAAGSLVTAVQFTAWTTAHWGSAAGITALVLSGYFRNALDDADVTSDVSGAAGFSSDIKGDTTGAFTAPKGPGATRAVDDGTGIGGNYQPSNTLVGIEVDLTTSGSGTLDVGIKNINATITYTPPAPPNVDFPLTNRKANMAPIRRG